MHISVVLMTLPGQSSSPVCTLSFMECMFDQTSMANYNKHLVRICGICYITDLSKELQQNKLNKDLGVEDTK